LGKFCGLYKWKIHFVWLEKGLMFKEVSIRNI